MTPNVLRPGVIKQHKPNLKGPLKGRKNYSYLSTLKVPSWFEIQGV